MAADIALKTGSSAGAIDVPTPQSRLESEGAYFGRSARTKEIPA